MATIGQRLRTRMWRELAAVQNRRFATRLAFRPDAPVLVLSPHLDDAVFDCWSVLTGARPCVVVNVFTRPPAAGTVTHWDRLAGARDSAVRIGERVVEDRAALAQAGQVPINLPFLDGAYRVGGRPPSFADIDAELVERLAAVSVVYAPFNLGVPHSDHVLVRDYALALAPTGARIRLYADLPYAVEYGWPAWVTGMQHDPYIDVDAFWQASGPPLACDAEGADVVALSASAARDKLAAMRTYRTQFPTLDRGPVGRLSNPAVHGFEVFWTAFPGAGER